MADHTPGTFDVKGFADGFAKTGNMPAKSEGDEKQTTAVKYCTNCGHPLIEGAKFCEECGAKVVQSSDVCTQCGYIFHNNAKFCPECGTKRT